MWTNFIGMHKPVYGQLAVNPEIVSTCYAVLLIHKMNFIAVIKQHMVRSYKEPLMPTKIIL